MNVWIIQESARMVSASIQMARSAVNAPSDTTWITLESTVLVRWFMILTNCNIRIMEDESFYRHQNQKIKNCSSPLLLRNFIPVPRDI